MTTLLKIIQKGGVWRPSLYLKIDNPPYMELVIEAMDESGPFGCLPFPSVTTANRTATSCVTPKCVSRLCARKMERSP